MISGKYAKYYKGQPVKDFSKLGGNITPLTFHIHGTEWNSDFKLDWFCITKPFVMIDEPHSHKFDQFLAFQNGDSTHVNEFDAEVWLYLGPKDEQERLIITETCFIHVPAGLIHTPLEFRRIGKPIVFMDITLTEEYVRQPEDKSKPEQRLPSD